MSLQHWMSFSTFAEQRYFVYPNTKTYAGILINANMVAHAPEGLAAFLLEKTNSTPYIIDPLTHAFQHDPGYISNQEGIVKSSIKSLANAYGETTKRLVGKRPIQPNDLAGEDLKEFVKSCIDFQRNALSKIMLSKPSNKYILFESTELESAQPYAVVAPYFYLSEISLEKWLPLMLQSVKISREYVGSTKLFMALVITPGVLLNTETRDYLLRSIEQCETDGFLLWIDGFEEHKASSTELHALLKFATELREKNECELINIHGSYFSVLAGGGQLEFQAFTGVSHGPEFGEYRSVVPVGGGIPIARYYVPQLHNRIKYRDSARYFNILEFLKDAKTFHSKVCDCKVCKRILDGNISNYTAFGLSTSKTIKRGNSMVSIEYPNKETKEICLTHYLENKSIEYTNASQNDRNALLKELQDGFDMYGEIGDGENVNHLEIWHRVLYKF